MADTLDSIIKSLDATYNPSRQLINERITGMPAEQDAEISGLNATKDQAFDSITNNARDRGMGFSGIPLQEQAKYTASEFLPAVARTKTAFTDRKTSLIDALNNIGIDQRKTAQGMFDTQTQMDFQREQAAAAKRAQDASNAAMSSLYSGNNPTPPGANTPAAAKIVQTQKNGPFSFADASGKPISAAAYAKLTNIPFRTLLENMASSGDQGAKAALGFVGNDFGYDPNKVNVDLYNALTWGVQGGAVRYTPPGPSYNITSNQGAQNTRNAITNKLSNLSMPRFGSGGSGVNAQLEAARAGGRI